LCLALVACGGTSAAPSVDTTPFVGTWEIYEMESDGEATSNEDVRLMRDFLGISVYLDVNEDGSLVLDVFGETMEGSWQATDASTLSATLDGQPVDVTLVGDKLTVAQNGSSITFVKIDPADRIDNAAGIAELESGESLDLEGLMDTAE
ncbi:MAG: hypothetical protein IJM67_07125, partial [Atopobiaceae bacterium]|nr:hypothetical protein [Atopobiaceae bacterium]